MDYELAKELREAGFPQGGEGNWKGGVYVPTFSELIEACGEELGWMFQTASGVWFAANAPTLIDATVDAHGKSPEEAVARLWLALNKR